MADKYYSIMVRGREPQLIQFGTLDKTTGLPNSDAFESRVQVGSIVIPNYSNVWGKKGLNKDSKPNGKIEFLKWGSEGGQRIEIRYLPTSKSLDKHYQEKVEMLKVEENDDVNQIVLKNGINDFDYATEDMLIELLKHHTYNVSSPCRNPSNTEYLFDEYSASKRLANRVTDEREIKKAKDTIIDNMDDDIAMKILAEIFDEDTLSQNDVIAETLIDKWIDTKKHGLFNAIIANRKEQAQETYQQGVSYKLLDDASVKNEVWLINGKIKEKLFSKVTSEDKAKWISDNFFTANVYDGLIKLKSVIEEHEAEKLNK